MDKIEEADAIKLQLLDRDIAIAQERFRAATIEVAHKYQIFPERGDKLNIQTREITRAR